MKKLLIIIACVAILMCLFFLRSPVLEGINSTRDNLVTKIQNSSGNSAVRPQNSAKSGGEFDFETSYIKNYIQNTHDDAYTVVEKIRKYEIKNRSAIAPAWTSWFAYKYPQEFATLAENSQIHEDELYAGFVALSENYPQLAFEKFYSISEQYPSIHKMLSEQLLTSWLESDSVEASRAIIAINSATPTVGKKYKNIVAIWLTKKGLKSEANKWK